MKYGFAQKPISVPRNPYTHLDREAIVQKNVFHTNYVNMSQYIP